MPTLVFDHDWTAAPLTSTGGPGTATAAGQDSLWLDQFGGAAEVDVDGTGSDHGLRMTSVGEPPVSWSACYKLLRPGAEACLDGVYSIWLPADPDLTVVRNLA